MRLENDAVKLQDEVASLKENIRSLKDVIGKSMTLHPGIQAHTYMNLCCTDEVSIIVNQRMS